jgi:hypothetical protein
MASQLSQQARADLLFWDYVGSMPGDQSGSLDAQKYPEILLSHLLIPLC